MPAEVCMSAAYIQMVQQYMHIQIYKEESIYVSIYVYV